MILKVLEETTDEKYTKIAYDVATYHHEKWDGTGYPEGLSGEEIPVSARIMAIADVYDALTMERVYKKPFSVKKALEIISEEAGKHFDPILAPLFVEVMQSIWI
jgi:putative two-component system response regulator